MLNVICHISVVVLVSGINWMSKADVKGVIKSQNATNYLVDFSESAKKENYIGDYSSHLIEKSKCVELK